MIRRSGQQGVPVIVDGDDVIVGFDRSRLERIAARYAQSPTSESDGVKLGLVVRDSAGGVEVGGVRPGSTGERAGVQPGDLLESLGNQPVRSVAELEQRAKGLAVGESLELNVRRHGQPVRLLVPVA